MSLARNPFGDEAWPQPSGFSTETRALTTDPQSTPFYPDNALRMRQMRGSMRLHDVLPPLQAMPVDESRTTRRWHDGVADASQLVYQASPEHVPLMTEALKQTKAAMEQLDRLAQQQSAHSLLRNAVVSTTQLAAEKEYQATQARLSYKTALGRHALGVQNAQEIRDAKASVAEATSAADKAAASCIAAHASTKASETAMLASKLSVRASLQSARSATDAALLDGAESKFVERARSALDGVLDENAQELDSLWPVKRDCAFLDSNVILGALRKSGNGENVCHGIAASVREGSSELSRVQCKPLSNGTCPARFDPGSCTLVRINVDDMLL